MSHVRFWPHRSGPHSTKQIGVVGRERIVSIETFVPSNTTMQGRVLLTLSVNDARTLAELLFKEATETEHRIFNTKRSSTDVEIIG